ncbi:single-stranded DNA-binding protein [Anaerotignum sp.]
MNKVILIGRLVRDPEVRYSQGAEPLAVARYTLAVDRPMKKNGEKEADFIGCVAFGKLGEFAEKYLKKGQQIAIAGRLQVRSWDDNEGKKRWTTEVIVGEHYFCGTKEKAAAAPAPTDGQAAPAPTDGQAAPAEGFYPIDERLEDDDLPF